MLSVPPHHSSQHGPAYRQGVTTSDTPPPSGTEWTGEWDVHFQDRIYGSAPVLLGDITALLTGLQHRDGSTISGVTLRVQGTGIPAGNPATVAADLTPGQARDLAETLLELAGKAEKLDGLG